ncbi:PREDICTED: uncharacterized protein LOC105566609 [Vollenhovia emeryi]|uniref:uncharacterized protein LOC105566609 n=1 Tax=Vollenhovia emeryi TaxID=411798 RepID=UPI0005F4C783|nr:PREDICTED: uncharacterized protein LOC105566609 [Vollenhovia emeryi]
MTDEDATFLSDLNTFLSTFFSSIIKFLIEDSLFITNTLYFLFYALIYTQTYQEIGKRRPKKTPAKEVPEPPLEEAKIKKRSKEQGAAVQEANSKAKTAKKGSARKAAPRGKNAVAEKIDEAEEAATSEVDIRQNGEAQEVEPKQKKRNAGRVNAAMNGKVEAKKEEQLKGQVAAAPVEEKDASNDVIAENEENDEKEINAAPEIDENGTKVDSASVLSPDENKTNEVDTSVDLIKDEPDTSTEVERAGNYLCF